jgi:peptidoglycan/LPS O-acetylase OafA/YrhL
MVIWGGSMPSDNNADMPRTSGSRYSIANISRIRPVQWLGDISYSLYLWHWPLISLAPYYLPDGELGRLDKIAIFMLSIAIGAVSYYCIERPFRTKRNKPAAMASA